MFPIIGPLARFFMKISNKSKNKIELNVDGGNMEV